MCVIAAVAIALDATTKSFLHAWLPNIGVAAISIAITAAVVEELIKRADRARVAGRVDYGERRLDHALLSLMTDVQMDYIRWLRGVEVTIGGDVVEILTRWLEGDGGLATRPALKPGERPYILLAALNFVDEVERVAEELREHLPPELAVQMSALAASRRQAEGIAPNLPGYSIPAAVDVFRARLILQAAKDFAVVYRSHRDPWPRFLVLDPGVLPAA